MSTVDWDEIRERYGPMVWSTAYRILVHDADAQDCVQDVFLEALDRTSAESIEDWGAFLRWLATRRALDALRKRKNRSMDQLLDVTNDPKLIESPEDKLAYDELLNQLRNSLATMPAQQAEAFWLGCVEEMSYEQVATQMKIEKGTVGTLIHRARETLRRQFAIVRPRCE